MIHYSYSTVMMALLSCGVVMALMTILFCIPKVLPCFGYKALKLFLWLTLLRFLLPVQFPFAKNLPLAKFFSEFVYYNRRILYKNSFIRLSIWRMFGIISAVGFLTLLIIDIYNTIKCEKYIKDNGIDVTLEEPYASFMKKICKGKKNPFKIICMPETHVPELHGIFSPKILLSDDLGLTEKELYYTLCHEVSHHYHHDVLMKCGIKLICNMYWWFIFSYFLKFQLDETIEMRVDHTVVEDDPEVLKEYTACLTKVADIAIALKEAEKAKKKIWKPRMGAFLFKGNREVLLSRYYMMSEQAKKPMKILSALLLSVIVAAYAFSYCFIWEAQYWTSEVTETTMELSEDNAYALLNDDGSYSIYYDGYLIDVIDNLQNYAFEIPVYSNLDDVTSDYYFTELK